MWSDNETDRDFLNFSGVAETVAEIIARAKGRPVSIGVSGAWGVGKSSMIKQTRAALAARPRAEGDREYVFVEFNAWLYQGYDDARAALIDVIASTLEKEATDRKTAVDKVSDLLKRVKWLRVAKTGAKAAVSMYFGVPPVGAVAELADAARRIVKSGFDADAAKEAGEAAGKLSDDAGGYLDPREDKSPPKEIQALRDDFEDILGKLGITLVVLIDDLDRCLPETTISTLEAIRLFLFLENTAFVIAADNDMIKHSVRQHFKGAPDERLVTSYFDKLVQVPIRVPQLGTQEVRAYLMLLYVENSDVDEDVKEQIRAGVIAQLRQTWQGKRVDRAFIAKQWPGLPATLMSRLEAAERLAPLMATATGIAGNPRLIKRFLNALSIGMSISIAQGVGVDEAVLAKLHLLERLGDQAAHTELVSRVSAATDGKPSFLSDWEHELREGKDVELKTPWTGPFVREWLILDPPLADLDLRGALYVSREQASLVTAEDRLSSDASEVLTALLQHPDMVSGLKGDIAKLSPQESNTIMSRLLDVARREQEWGTPDILIACIAIADADPVQGERLTAFLSALPEAQIQPNIVPRIADRPWAKKVVEAWERGDVSKPVKTAIAANKRKAG